MWCLKFCGTAIPMRCSWRWKGGVNFQRQTVDTPIACESGEACPARLCARAHLNRDVGRSTERVTKKVSRKLAKELAALAGMPDDKIDLKSGLQTVHSRHRNAG